MDVDPVASMRCWPITVELAGREYEIPALPAVDWWPVLVDHDVIAVLDIVESGSDLDEMLLDGVISGEELTEALTDAIETATGRSFHAGFILATVANSSWPVIGGSLAQKGFRWDVQPIGAALDAIYAVVVGALEKDEREKFLAMLENESLTQPGKKRTPSQRVVSEFESMAGTRPSPAPVPGAATAEQSSGLRSRTRQRRQPPRQVGRSAAPRTQP